VLHLANLVGREFQVRRKWSNFRRSCSWVIYTDIIIRSFASLLVVSCKRNSNKQKKSRETKKGGEGEEKKKGGEGRQIREELASLGWRIACQLSRGGVNKRKGRKEERKGRKEGKKGREEKSYSRGRNLL
jgi:hypothetical protein